MSPGVARSKLLRDLEDRLEPAGCSRAPRITWPRPRRGAVFAEGRAQARVVLERGCSVPTASRRGGGARLSIVATSALGPHALFELVGAHVGHDGLARVRWSHDDDEIPFNRRGVRPVGAQWAR